MTLSIRSPEAVSLARRLAQLDETTITEAVVAALKEAVRQRTQQESASGTARRLLEKHGLAFGPDRSLVPAGVWHDLDGDARERNEGL